MAFVKPSRSQLHTLSWPLRVARKVVRPVFHGMDKVPTDRPLMFIGNHQLFGVLDIPFLFYELLEKKDIFLRGVGDKHHFLIPLWREFLESFGVIEGTRENCRPLLEQGESLLIFPGGGREVAKRKGEKYKLIWKERLGFIKLALEFGCTIVPFGAIGIEDAFDIVIDGDEILASPFGKIIKKVGFPTYAIPPITTGLKGTPLPRPERLYFGIGDPIRTTPFTGQQHDDEICRSLRDQVKTSVEGVIQSLVQQRSSDYQSPFV